MSFEKQGQQLRASGVSDMSDLSETNTQKLHKSMRSQTKIRSLILIAASAIFMFLMCVGTLFSEDISFSENENRYLQQKPKFSISDVLSGRFEEQTEKYLDDQIVGRDIWVGSMSAVSEKLGISDVNGVYICEGGRVVKRITETDFDWERYEKNLRELAKLKESCMKNGKEFYAMLVPTAAYVYADDLPKNAMRFDEDAAFAEAEKILSSSLIDLRDAMLTAADGKGENLGADGGVFFRTDHHWSGYGAYLGYRGFAEARGHDMMQGIIPSYEETEPTVLSDDFYGTLYSKVLLSSLIKDSVETPQAALEAAYSVTFNGESYDSLYFDEYLAKKDKYAVFFGGNYDKVDIETGNGSGSLLIIKDSFANSFVPYILGDYDRITMIDSRYYRGNTEELVQDYDELLVLYGIDNFAEEKLRLSEAVLK